MEAASTAKEATTTPAVVMQMVMGAYVAKAIPDVTRLNVPDVLNALDLGARCDSINPAPEHSGRRVIQWILSSLSRLSR